MFNRWVPNDTFYLVRVSGLMQNHRFSYHSALSKRGVKVVDSCGTPFCAFLQPESHCVLELIFSYSFSCCLVAYFEPGTSTRGTLALVCILVILQ